MVLSLTDEKNNKSKVILTDSLGKYKISLRELARILGNIVASFPAVAYGPLFYKHLEREKITGLKYHKGNFEEKIDYLLKQKLRYNGRLIILTIHATMLTYLILTSLNILMQVLQAGASLMVYPHPGDSGIKQG